MFDEVRLPIEVEKGARGGPGFSTSILTLRSGYEQRNQNWSRSRGRWDVSFGIDVMSQLETVVAFFYARRGRLNGFRFRDWSDYQLTASEIGLGDAAETDFQAVRRYTDSGGNTFDRPISKLVTGTLTVFVDSVAKSEGPDYSVDYDTGIITFTSPPGSGLSVAITTEFDVPVRFDIDELEISLEAYDPTTGELGGLIPSIPVVELRV